MYNSAQLIPHLSSPPAYFAYRAVLVDVHGVEQWHCEHAHYFDILAIDCAEYELQRRLQGQRP